MWFLCHSFLVDPKCPTCYNLGMKTQFNEGLQWIGAVWIIAGHSLNAIGPSAYPYNILAFFLGTIFFLWWTVRVANKPQMLVNIVAITISGAGLYKAIG